MDWGGDPMSSAHFIVEFGCYVDGIHGIYAPNFICDFARSLGWTGNVPSEADCQDRSDDTHADADEAIEWLNENVSGDDASFGWHEGGLFYWSHAEWEEAC
jgi:hypothetical protein